MAPGVDPAILEGLGLEASVSKMSPYSSGFASMFKLVSQKEGQRVEYFIKIGTGRDAEIMFRGEHESLNAIHAAVPNFCPKSFAHGALSSRANTFFLATEFLDLNPRSGSVSGASLAAKLAKMHTTRAPTPDESEERRYGFPVPTCCGATVQDNSWKESWSSFYADNRLRGIAKEITAKGHADSKLLDFIERTASEVVPRLLDSNRLDVLPVVIHGDLWSGNHSRGKFMGRNDIEEVVYDPACVYGHSEYELGIMRMFGGFGPEFWSEYETLVPRAEPVSEWEDRVSLYELYHHLNHVALFGGGYRGSAMGIMRGLIAKYGESSRG